MAKNGKIEWILDSSQPYYTGWPIRSVQTSNLMGHLVFTCSSLDFCFLHRLEPLPSCPVDGLLRLCGWRGILSFLMVYFKFEILSSFCVYPMNIKRIPGVPSAGAVMWPWVKLTLIWICNHLPQLPSRFCQIPMSPRLTVDYQNPSQPNRWDTL